MAKKEFAPGLPDPRRFGDIGQLPKNQQLLWVVQKHLAERAGPHYDIRFGVDKGKAPSLFSFATRKLPEQPGQKVLIFQQPLHTGQYADFEGDIVSGYGKGVVKTHDKGTVLVTKVEPDKINFVVVHRKFPENFTLIRKSGAPKGATTARQRKTQGGSWLMINTTPTDVIEHQKVHYTKVPEEDVEKMFSPDYLASEKIDGAAALYKLFSDKIEVLSYRPSTTGRPIVHTYRVGGTTGINVPKHLVGSVLRGEIYGTRTATGDVIPAQELGGLLNATTAKSLKAQKQRGIELKNALFNVLRYGRKDVPMSAPLDERLKYLREVLSFLPSGKFHMPTTADTPDEQRKLWQEIVTGKNPRTHEGMVFWPKKGGKPTKVKLYDEHDVYIREFFPGKRGLAGKGVGGFKYSTEPAGPILGEVGTGLSKELRRQMMEQPEEFKGRVARIRAQEQFPSGAYRAPSLIAPHEDYPAKAAMVKEALRSLGKLGLGLTAGGILGTALVRGWLEGKRPTQGPAGPGAVAQLRRAIGAEGLPSLVPGELAPGQAAGVTPTSAGYFAPELPADRRVMESWLQYAPELAESARTRGAVITGSNPSLGLLAHEFGHGTGLGAKPAWRHTVQRLAARGIGPGFVASGLAGAALSGLGKIKGGLAGGLVGAGAQLPTLIEETRANLRARKALKDMGITDPAAYRKLRAIQIAQTIPAIGSAATGAGAALLMRALRKAGSFNKAAQTISEQAKQIPSPTTWSGLAGEAAFFPAAKTLWHGVKTVGKHFAPGAALKSVGSWLGSPIALGVSATTDLANALISAKYDPDYQGGNISFGQAFRNQLGTRGEAAQLKAQQAFKGKLGTLKGLLSSPVQGIMSPVGTLAGFAQALGRTGKRLVGMDSKQATILAPYIKQAIEAAGGEGETLVDMVKLAQKPPAFLEESNTGAPAFMQGEQAGAAGLKQRLLGWLLNVKPEELSGASAALSGLGRLSNRLRGLATAPKETLPESPYG